jgi:hypothetical protein
MLLEENLHFKGKTSCEYMGEIVNYRHQRLILLVENQQGGFFYNIFIS